MSRIAQRTAQTVLASIARLAHSTGASSACLTWQGGVTAIVNAAQGGNGAGDEVPHAVALVQHLLL